MSSRSRAAVESVMAAIEVLEDLRHDYTRLTAAAMVAGNVWNAGVVLGEPVTDWRRLDLAQAAARLTINGREIGQGRGGDVMGNPLNALAWLANKLAAAGTPLKAGMIVMTGSMVPIQFPPPATVPSSRSRASAPPSCARPERHLQRQCFRFADLGGTFGQIVRSRKQST